MSQLKKLIFIAAAAAATAALTGEAFAHAHLKAAVPAADSTVTEAPAELDLTFTEGLNLKFSGIVLTDAKKATVSTGEATLMDGDTTLMVPVTGKLQPGTYTVDWHALSTDGHKTNGAYTFIVKP